jgi:MSHA biogenesis protein MshJ
MKERLKLLAGRFEALPARERKLIVAAALLAVAFLFYLLLLQPGLAAKKRVSTQVAEARKTLATLQELKARPGEDPYAARRAERDALRKQLADVDRTMAQVQRGLVPPERTARLLEDVLRGGSGLQLVSLRTLPVRRFDAKGVPGAEGAGGASDAERQLYQHGFEITVQGSYADLHHYLRRIEELPWRLFWNRISLSVDPQHYPKLSVTLTVQTISLNKAWLVL